jgi:hypothetical protein
MKAVVPKNKNVFTGMWWLLAIAAIEMNISPVNSIENNKIKIRLAVFIVY